MRSPNKHVTVREAFTVSEVARDITLDTRGQMYGVFLLPSVNVGKLDRRKLSINVAEPTVFFSTYSDYAYAVAIIQTAESRNILGWIKAGWSATASVRRSDSFIEYAEKVLRWTETLTVKPVGFYLPDQDLLKLNFSWSDTGADDWVYIEATSSSRPFNKYIYDFSNIEVVDADMKHQPIHISKLGNSVKIVCGDDVMYFSESTKAGFILSKCVGE